MTTPEGEARPAQGLPSYPWELSYKTSSTLIEGRPLDMLHDFYIPALRLAAEYDRVAGYFRSSSLAAASQGFSAFVNHGGKMRLIVGADLEPGDIKAILEGDHTRLESRLNGELSQPEQWPEGVRNGVALLGWMVASGCLEVKVAFRLHKVTGEPLSFEAVDDGYVHEKWFILRDQFGNRLYGSGTLNESKTGLVLNAENIDVHCDWWGSTDGKRVEDAQAAFENLWGGHVKHMPVLSIPDAVTKKLINFADGIEYPVEVDGSSAVPRGIEPPSALERLKFAVVKDAPLMPGGRYVGLETAPVDPWPHQRIVARRLIDSWPYSYLLCDEVGLGKTIEAGLAIRALHLSGIAKRVLIAAPASLTRQWQREMASKMLLSFGRVYTGPQTGHEYVWPREERVSSARLFDPNLTIVSTGLLARKERAEGLRSCEAFDVALVDEAHYARRRNPNRGAEVQPDYGQLYKSINEHLRKQARGLWLATATPMQLHLVEVADLLALTNRVGSFQFDPTLMQQYYDLLSKLLHDEDISAADWEFLRRVVLAVQSEDPLYWQYLSDNVIDGRIRATVKQWLEYGRVPRGRDRQLTLRLLFSASPLARVMQRHTRKLLEIYRERGQLAANLATRHVLPIPRIVFTDQEQAAYEALEVYCNGLNKQLSKVKDAKTGNLVSFLLSFLRLRFASSLFAIKQTLHRRLKRVEETLAHQMELMDAQESEEALEDWVYDSDTEDDTLATRSLLKNRSKVDLEWERERLKDMLVNLEDLSGPSSKMQEFLRQLDGRRHAATRRIRQTVVFTRFYDTLVDIVNRLRQADPGMRIGTYSGQGCTYYDPHSHRMVSVDREEVKKRYLRGEVDILVCTDAAAEGLNLQTADLLVNFDLGWNPMKIEQRIGRIDRIGQIHSDVYVLNLCYAGSAEEIVYGRLLDRLEKANLIVGMQQISLLPVTPEEFEALAEHAVTLETLEERATERLKEQQRRTASMEISPSDLYEIYMRMEESGPRTKAPISLDAMWEVLTSSRYLKDLGCEVAADPSAPAIYVRGVDGVADGAMLTASRDLFETGPDVHTRVHFASYGDQVFNALVAHLTSFELPGCVQRLTVQIPGLDGVEMVAYGVVQRKADGTTATRLVRCWEDLKELQLAEEVTLTPEESDSLRVQLKALAEEDFKAYRVAHRIERENLLAAHGQEVLGLLAIEALLAERANFADDGALFGTVIEEVKGLYKDRAAIQVYGLPSETVRPFVPYLLFDVNIPTLGSQASLNVPRPLAHAAIDSARRLADGLKMKKGEMRVDLVLSRIRRVAEAKAGQALRG